MSYASCRQDNNLAGTAIGAVTGGLLGNIIAGSGDRTEGAIIGVLLGGVVGNRIDASDNRRRYYQALRTSAPFRACLRSTAIRASVLAAPAPAC